MGGDKLWCRDMEVKGERKDREDTVKVFKMVLGIRRRTPGYMVREELQRKKMRGRAGMGASGYERKLGEGKGGELARLCWEEMRESKEEKSNRGVGEGKENVL